MLKVKAIFFPLKWYRIKALVAGDAEATNEVQKSSRKQTRQIHRRIGIYSAKLLQNRMSLQDKFQWKCSCLLLCYVPSHYNCFYKQNTKIDVFSP